MARFKFHRRYFRFSLSMLLVLVTVVAIWLGFSMNRLRRQKAAIVAIDDLGGTYGVRVEGPEWLRNLMGDRRYFCNASRVSFGPRNDGYDPNRPFTNEELEAVIDHLNAFDRFKELDLDQSDITDDGLVHLSRLRNLEYLRLAMTAITDRGLAHLEGLSTLGDLDLTETKTSPEGIARLKQSLPDCKIIIRP